MCPYKYKNIHKVSMYKILNKNTNNTLLPFSGVELTRYTTFSMYTEGLFLSNTNHKSTYDTYCRVVPEAAQKN